MKACIWLWFIVASHHALGADLEQPDVIHINMTHRTVSAPLQFDEILSHARNRQQQMAETLGETDVNPVAKVKHTVKALGSVSRGLPSNQPESIDVGSLKNLANAILSVFLPSAARQTSTLSSPVPTPTTLPDICSFNFSDRQSCGVAYSSCLSTFRQCVTSAKSSTAIFNCLSFEFSTCFTLQGICQSSNPVLPSRCSQKVVVSSKAVTTKTTTRTTSTSTSRTTSSSVRTTSVPTSVRTSTTSTARVTSTSSVPVSTPSATRSTSTSSVRSSTSASPVSSSASSANIGVQNDLWNSVMVFQALWGSAKAVTMAIFDTGSTDSWTMTNQCSNCNANGHHIFDTSKSTSFSSSSSSFSVTYGDGSSSSGFWGSDTLYVGPVSATSQAFGIPTSVSSSWVSSGYSDGIIGMAYPALGTSGRTPFIQNLFAQKQIPQPIVGMAMNTASYYGGQYQPGGTLTLGGVNPSFISGSLVAVPVTRQLYWQVNLDGIKIASSSTTAGTSISGSSVIVDSGTTLILLSDSQVSAFYSAIGGFSSSGTWVYPCGNSLNFYFQLGGKWFGIPASGLFFNYADSSQVNCIGTVQSYGNVGLAILGEAFLRYVYASFDFTDNTVKLGTRSDLPAVP